MMYIYVVYDAKFVRGSLLLKRTTRHAHVTVETYALICDHSCRDASKPNEESLFIIEGLKVY